MQFIDETSISIKAGHGGSGKVSFRREKYIPKGPPDGGNGGHGGHIILRTTPNLGSLLQYRFRKFFEAPSGRPGGTRDCSGRNGEDLVLPIPRGTLIYDEQTGDLVKDLSNADEELLIARGGRGGKGNAHFCSSTNKSPRFSQPGEVGEELKIRFELKLLADVGLLGMPNAGKSSFIRSVTKAKPKVADYPFTTLNPHLGVVQGPDQESFVIADIPGLIKDASHGAGLGLDFLRHVERSRLLLHLIDISPMAMESPDQAYLLIEKELKNYKKQVLQKPRWIVLTKSDITDEKTIQTWTTWFKEKKRTVFCISSVAHRGLQPLIKETTCWVANQRQRTS